MRDISFSALVLVLVIVVEIAALQPRFTDQSKNAPDDLSLIEGRSYGSSNRVKEKHNVDPSYFPAYVRPLFGMKLSIQSSIHRIEDGRTALDAIKALKTKLTSLLAEAAEDFLQVANLKCVVPSLTASGPIYGLLFGDKCYVVSSQIPKNKKTYEKAQQECLKLGGQLAQPNLMPGSTFGTDLASVYNLDEHNYWIFGTATSSPTYQIVAGGGYKIPQDFFRYVTMNNVRSSQPNVQSDSGLTLLGGLPPGTSEWYINVKDTDTERPFICEFRAIADPLPESDDDSDELMKYFRSPLMKKLLKMSPKGKFVKSYGRLSLSPKPLKEVKSDETPKEEELKLNQQTKADQNPEIFTPEKQVENVANPEQKIATVDDSSKVQL